jgi:hypothetical protein
MSINRNNFEEYVIDLLDGKLNSEMQQELMLFFALNPDLEQESAMLELVKINPNDELIFENKSLLKKTDSSKINAVNLEEYLIAKIENDLTQSLLYDLDSYISNKPHAKEELNLFLATKNKANLSIVYPNKSELKRKTKLIWLNYLYAAAAIIILILSIPFFVNKTLQEQPTFSSATKVKSNPPLAIKHTTNASNTIMVSEVKKQKNKKVIRNNVVRNINHELKIRTVNSFELTQIATLNYINQKNFEPVINMKTIEINNSLTSSDEKMEENEDTKAPYLNLKQAGIKSIKDASAEAIVLNGKANKNYNKISWSDIAAFAIAKINKKTGSNIRIEKKVDESGNEIAYGITSNSFGFSRK